MMIILYFLIGCILYAAYLFLIVLYGNLDTTDVSDEKFGETLKNVASLSGPLRARVEGALDVLKTHPDLRNQLGMSVSKRYADQLASITSHYAGVCKDQIAGVDSSMNKGVHALMNEGYSATQAHLTHYDNGIDPGIDLFDQGLSLIEAKIEKALALKGQERREDLDVYVRFLENAD